MLPSIEILSFCCMFHRFLGIGAWIFHLHYLSFHLFRVELLNIYKLCPYFSNQSQLSIGKWLVTWWRVTYSLLESCLLATFLSGSFSFDYYNYTEIVFLICTDYVTSNCTKLESHILYTDFTNCIILMLLIVNYFWKISLLKCIPYKSKSNWEKMIRDHFRK